jgi:hypothetical protein
MGLQESSPRRRLWSAGPLEKVYLGTPEVELSYTKTLPKLSKLRHPEVEKGVVDYTQGAVDYTKTLPKLGQSPAYSSRPHSCFMATPPHHLVSL